MNNNKFKSKISSMGKKVKRKIINVPSVVRDFFEVGDAVEVKKVEDKDKNKS